MQKKHFTDTFNVDVNEIISEVTSDDKQTDINKDEKQVRMEVSQEQDKHNIEQENKDIKVDVASNVNIYDIVTEVVTLDKAKNNKVNSINGKKSSARTDIKVSVDDIISISFQTNENKQSSKSVFNVDLFDLVSAESTHKTEVEEKFKEQQEEEEETAYENGEETEEQTEGEENSNGNKKEDKVNKETGLLDYKGAIWRAVDYILFGQSAVKLETNDVSLMLYNTAKANLLRVAYQIRQELNKPVTTVISEPVVEETAKQVLETIDRLLTLQYPKVKPVLEEQAKKLVTESNSLTMQEAKDTVYSQLVAKLALDWLLLGLTNNDINRIKNDELLKLMVQEYLECRESLFDYTTIK